MYDLYPAGTASYDPTNVDARHYNYCPGCNTCRMAEERAEREFNRDPRNWS